MSRPFICSNCEAAGEPDDPYCSECGWDGVIFAVDRKYPPGTTFTLNPENDDDDDQS